MIYVALIRGIMPMNPNMKSAKLKEFFESLGFKNVTTVIASGNVVFESDETDEKKLEDRIEKALPEKLGFTRATIIRSKKDLEKLAEKDPFKGVVDEKPNYLLVTFFKDRRPELSSVLNLSDDNSTNFMAKIDKEYDKQVTTRTWKTVNRVLKTMALINP